MRFSLLALIGCCSLVLACSSVNIQKDASIAEDENDNYSDEISLDDLVPEENKKKDEPSETTFFDGLEDQYKDELVPEQWSWCPSEDDFVGEDWEWTLLVANSALYCVFCDESGVFRPDSLEKEWARKAQLKIVSGQYPVPSINGEYSFRLPVCLKSHEPNQQPLLAEPGWIHAEHVTNQGKTTVALEFQQALYTSNGEKWNLLGKIYGPLAPEQKTIRIDGNYTSPNTGDGMTIIWKLCPGDCGPERDSLAFASCHFQGVSGYKHLVSFQGGKIDLYLRIGELNIVAGNQPALFNHAVGELDHEGFDQLDYWKLVFTGGPQHYFVRHFLVLFDRPIGESCGIKVENLDIWDELPPARVAIVRCDLGEIEERQVIQESWEDLP